MKQNEFKSKGLTDNSGDTLLSDETSTIELFASEASKHSIPDSYEIPYAYNIDKIVIMPVNDETSFIYWELTNRLPNSKRHELNVGSVHPVIKIYGIEQGSKKEIYSFEVKEKIGKRYIKYNTSFKLLVAEAGIVQEGEFIGLLKSKTISKASFETRDTEGEIWMKKIRDIFRYVRLPGSKIANDSTPITKRTGLYKYYREATELHVNPLSSNLILTLPSLKA